MACLQFILKHITVYVQMYVHVSFVFWPSPDSLVKFFGLSIYTHVIKISKELGSFLLIWISEDPFRPY